ncbi:MAG: metallophosphoesterase family protein [Eubacterium sp.]|nr:metallophosphoesterase family protein [Eubacterium sp.]
MILILSFAGMLVIPLGIYLYRLIRRFLGVFCKERRLRLQKLSAAVMAAVAAAFSINLFGLWALVVFYTVGIAAVTDVVWLILKKRGYRPGVKADMVYRTCLLPVLVTAVILGYAYVNMHHVTVASYTVDSQKEIRQEGYRIVFLSDLHFGTTMDADKLREYCARMEQEKPDLVVLGGDIVDEATLLSEAEEAFAALAQIDSTYGTYYVYGNHDKGRYASDCDFTQEELAETIRDAGVHILEDESVLLNNELSITGRCDRSDASASYISRKASADLIADLPQEGFHMIADHQPRDMEENAAAGFDLMLSGHTHAGQMWPVGLFTELFDKKTVNYGEKSFGDMHLIVSSGIAGWGYPLRTGKHSEYVVIQIV